ncbi:MAG: hypothetical protein AAGN35_11795 [Bacteroidota bacterium]
MKIKAWYLVIALAVVAVGCKDPVLEVPTSYVSASYEANVATENTVIGELSTMTSAANDAESNAQSSTVAAISYPTNLSGVTEANYRAKVGEWLTQLVNAANSTTGFQTPAVGDSPMMGEEGGLLGSRLLDENGLELEQMIQKGSFGAALYNHALTVINGDLSNSSAIDKLVEIHGTDASFDVSGTTAAATYSRRRSNLDAQTGFFFDIKNALITAKAAIDQGGDDDDFVTDLNTSLDNYLLAWEKSNFATVIYYSNAAKTGLQDASALPDGQAKDDALGNAMHAYAEGVAFAAGFRGISRKMITDAQIDSILALLLAPAGQTPTSYRFLNEASLLSNFDQVISDIQGIYGFTAAEVTSFYVNNNP